MRYRIAIIFTFIFLAAGCTNQSRNNVCELKEIRTLFTVVGIQQGVDTGYVHYVLLREFSRQCMDSTTLVNIALKYIDTVSIDKPIDMINFYNSDKNFIPGEVSQVWEKVDKNCLVHIWINKKNNKPEKFVFFNDKGERIFEGNKWVSYKRN
jgi:hypothetical protein